jgi:hypothetical protein
MLRSPTEEAERERGQREERKEMGRFFLSFWSYFDVCEDRIRIRGTENGT